MSKIFWANPRVEQPTAAEFCFPHVRHFGRASRKGTNVLIALIASTTLANVASPDQVGLSSTSSNQSASTELEEITVTATRRAESVEKVPISIVALSEKDLAAGGIKDIADIAAVTPGLQFAAPYGSISTVTAISIRGFNTLAGESLVGVYLDDTPIHVRLSTITNFGSPYPGLFDMKRVEVERGPQSTLFGAGSEAGAVRFISNSPSLTEFSGFSHAELASTRDGGLSYEAGAAVGGPIVEDKVGFRVSVWDRHDGGYIDRIEPYAPFDTVARNVNHDDKLAIKGALALQVNEDIRITPSVFYQSGRVHDGGYFYGNFSDPSTGHFVTGRLLPDLSTDHFVLSSVEVEAHLPFAELTSITSYMYRDGTASNDSSSFFGAIDQVKYGNPLGPAFAESQSDVAPQLIGQTVRGFTEEIRLASTQRDAFVTWVAGIFYDHRSQVDSLAIYSAAVDPTAPLICCGSELNIDDQIAAFAQGDFHVTDKLTATLGARVSKVHNEQRVNEAGSFTTDVPPVSYTTLKETPFTPRVALSYQADHNNLFYIAASKGFRVGGGNFPPSSLCNAAIPNTFNSDYVWSYEVGAKNKLFDGRVQIDSNVFHIDWSKAQQLELQASCGYYYIANTGSAVSNGFDLALQALVTDRLRVNLDVGYVDAYFTSNVLDSAGKPLVLKGDKIGTLPQVNPPWDVNTSATYEFALPNGEKIHLRGEYQYHSRNPGPFTTQIPTSQGYFPQLVADPPTHLFNARVGVTVKKLDVTLFVDNVFNTHPLLSMFQDALGENLIVYKTLRPRTVGLSANLEF
jgi:iron complex outermembrane receptor protein